MNFNLNLIQIKKIGFSKIVLKKTNIFLILITSKHLSKLPRKNISEDKEEFEILSMFKKVE